MYIYIRSMSLPQKEIADNLVSASKMINKHIIKLVLYPDAQEYNHWKKEIFSFLSDIDRLKGKNKFPSKQFIQKWLSVHNDMTDSYMYQITSDYDLHARKLTQPTVDLAIERYQEWLAEELSTRGVITFKDASSVLDEIVRKTYKEN